MKRAVLILLLCLCPSLALAAEPASPVANANPNPSTPAWLGSHHDGDPDPPPPPGNASRLRGVLAAFMVMTLIGFAVWTKTKKRGLAVKNPTAYVTVSDSVKVGEKAHLVVATIGDRTVVLGVTEHGVRRLMDVDRPKAAPASKRADVAATKAKPAVERNARRPLRDDLREDADARDAADDEPKSSGAMLAAASIKSRFQSILNRAKTVTRAGSTATDRDTDFVADPFGDQSAHWSELDDELRAAQADASEMEAAPPPGAISAPLLRVANDTNDRTRMRLSGSHAIDPLGIEEQVAGLLAARARRN